jgi:predicted helicase
MIDMTPDVNFWGSEGGQFFPRYTYKLSDTNGDLFSEAEDGKLSRQDNISAKVVKEFSKSLGFNVSSDDVFYYTYAILNCPEYRSTFAADLKKVIPRIPVSANFVEFAKLGRSLSDLHLSFRTLKEFQLTEKWDGKKNFEVKKMVLKRSLGRDSTASIIYNDSLVLSEIPEKAFEYPLGSKSCLDWLVSRYQFKKDDESGIVNDPNDWLAYTGDAEYLVKLIKRIVTLSLQSTDLIQNMPPLAIESP